MVGWSFIQLTPCYVTLGKLFKTGIEIFCICKICFMGIWGPIYLSYVRNVIDQSDGSCIVHLILLVPFPMPFVHSCSTLSDLHHFSPRLFNNFSICMTPYYQPVLTEFCHPTTRVLTIFIRNLPLLLPGQHF